MKARTIAKILDQKFSAFLKSLPENLQADVSENSLITGGAIASMLMNEKVNDFDVYFTNNRTALAVAKHYAALFVSSETGNPVDAQITKDNRVVLFGAGLGPDMGMRMDETPGEVEDRGAQEAVDHTKPDGTYRILFLSPNAITLTDGIQIVIRFTGEASEIHKNYDFVHCTNYWTSKDGSLTLHPAALEAILTRELRYMGSKYPLCSIIRTRKFVKRGWSINAGQFLKMALQLNDLDLLDLDVLKEQLVGVDSAHFMGLLNDLKDKSAEKLNSNYICKLIDHIF